MQDLGAFLRAREALIGRSGELVVAIGAVGLIVALFLDWYDPIVALRSPDGTVRPDEATLNGWEAFELADVVLVVMAALGLASFAAARSLGSRLPYVLAAQAGWFAVVVVLYSYWRPDHLDGFAAYPGSPAGGFFLALWAGGAMAGGALTALLAGARAAAPAPAEPPPTA